MKIRHGIAILVSALAWAPALAAQDEADEPETVREAAARNAEESEPPPAPEPDEADEPAAGAPAREVFVPTEEISEDIEVPFPVDI